MVYPLGQPLDYSSLFHPSFCLIFLFPFRAAVGIILSLCSYYIVISLSLCLSMDARDRPLVNLIISATPDKRCRQNVISVRSHSPYLLSDSKWCRQFQRSARSYRIHASSFFHIKSQAIIRCVFVSYY